jgi:hypothetical protein
VVPLPIGGVEPVRSQSYPKVSKDLPAVHDLIQHSFSLGPFAARTDPRLLTAACEPLILAVGGETCPIRR